MLSKFHVYSQRDLAGLADFIRNNIGKPNGLKDYFVLNIIKSLKEKLKDCDNLENEMVKSGVIVDLPTLLHRIELIINSNLTEKSWAFLQEYHDILINIVNDWLRDKLRDSSPGLNSYLNEYAKEVLTKSWNAHQVNSSNNPVIAIIECELVKYISQLSADFTDPKCDEFKKYYIPDNLKNSHEKKKKLIVEGLLDAWLQNRELIPNISKILDERLQTVILELYKTGKLTDNLIFIKEMLDNRNDFCPVRPQSKGNRDIDLREALDSFVLASPRIAIEMRRDIITAIMSDAIIKTTPILFSEYNKNVQRWIDFSVILDCVVNIKNPLSDCLSELMDETLRLIKQSINPDDTSGPNLDFIIPDVCKALRMIKTASPITKAEDELRELRKQVKNLASRCDDLLRSNDATSELDVVDNRDYQHNDRRGESRFFNNNNI